jgi:hypothetical protein
MANSGSLHALTDRHLFLDMRPEDDGERTARLAGIMHRAGWDCGDVEEAVMLSVGTWTVRCSKGHNHRVVFDSNGRLAHFA